MGALFKFVMVCLRWIIVWLTVPVMLAKADWVEVTGVAPYKASNYELSREQAREDAFRQAAMRSGTRVMSEQRMENGVLIQDQVQLLHDAHILRSRVKNEFIWKGMLNLVMDVEVEAAHRCEGAVAQPYKKTVAVMGFSLQVPDQARLGHLFGVNRGLASALSQALHRQNKLVVYENSHEHLQADMVNAPSRFNRQRTLTKTADFAREMGSQFVVSGVIRDLGVQVEKSFGNSHVQRLTRFMRHANLKRRFAVDVFIHDGFSGAIVWQRDFAVTGNWDIDPIEKVGFGTPAFLETDYGQAVQELVGDIAIRVEQELRCQPFMTRISRINGKTLHFDSGADTGIRPGDKLAVYRTYQFYDADQMQGAELTNVKTALTVSQVHPSFSSGTIAVDPGRLNIQEDDLLIVW